MNEDLIGKAEEARENAYAPYSKFKVGAALETQDGEIFTGANMENSSYGCSICAERAAVVKAVNNGKKNFKRIAVVSSSDDETFPCGICRQVLSEFSRDMKIILKNKEGKITEYALSELIPHSFSL